MVAFVNSRAIHASRISMSDQNLNMQSMRVLVETLKGALVRSMSLIEHFRTRNAE
jgi:hypothetical protein